MEFSCKKTLGGKGLKPYPPLVVPTTKDGGLLHRKPRFVRFKDSWRTSSSPKLAFIPFNPCTGQYMLSHPITHLSVSSIPSPHSLISHPFICASIHPSISLSLLSVMENLLFTKPHMRCRQCKINEDTCSTIRDQPSF